jgi:kynurenine 3-monooxygenase
MKMRGPQSFAEVSTGAEAERFFSATFADVLAICPDLVEQYMHNPTGAFATTKVSSLSVGAVALAGDAAHATVPFAGQGINAALESAHLLAQHLSGADPSLWPQQLAAYSRARLNDVHAMVDLSTDNYEALSSLHASRSFGWRCALQDWKCRLTGRPHNSLYTLLNFTHHRYHEVLDITRTQNQAHHLGRIA